MAESAEIGRLIGVVGLDISMMTTWADSPTFSRTQINLSDSMVRVLKVMLAALIPIEVSYNQESERRRKQCVKMGKMISYQEQQVESER